MTLKQADILKLVIGGVAAIGFATAVSAKGHDQGQTTTPGEDVQTETVDGAQGLGDAIGTQFGFAPATPGGDNIPG